MGIGEGFAFLTVWRCLAMFVDSMMHRVTNCCSSEIKRWWGGTVFFSRRRACVLSRKPWNHSQYKLIRLSKIFLPVRFGTQCAIALWPLGPPCNVHAEVWACYFNTLPIAGPPRNGRDQRAKRPVGLLEPLEAMELDFEVILVHAFAH